MLALALALAVVPVPGAWDAAFRHCLRGSSVVPALRPDHLPATAEKRGETVFDLLARHAFARVVSQELGVIPRSGPWFAEKNDATSKRSKQAFVGRPTNACLDRPLATLPFPGTVYVLKHAENLSFVLQRQATQLVAYYRAPGECFVRGRGQRVGQAHPR